MQTKTRAQVFSETGPLCGRLTECRKRTFPKEQLIDNTSDFCSVGRLELFHNVADMNLYSAFTQLQFISNDLVGFTATQRINHFSLTLGEHAPKG